MVASPSVNIKEDVLFWVFRKSRFFWLLQQKDVVLINIRDNIKAIYFIFIALVKLHYLL